MSDRLYLALYFDAPLQKQVREQVRPPDHARASHP